MSEREIYIYLNSLTKIFSLFPPRSFTVISSPEQYQRYKNDFNSQYREYRRLHAKIEVIQQNLTKLQNDLKQVKQSKANKVRKSFSLKDAHKSVP